MRASTTTAFAVFMVFAAARAASAGTILVPQDHATIQAAIDAAQPGDKIKIAKGTYSEPVAIGDRTQLTLLGSGKKTILRDQNVGIEITNSTGISIQNLVVENTLGDGVSIHDSDSITLRGCIVRDTGGHGVFSDSSSSVRIDRCTFDTIGDDAINLSADDETGLANDCTVKSCRIDDCGADGISIRGARNTVRSCKVYDCGDDGIETRDWDGDSDTMIKSCTVELVADEGFQIQGRGTTVQSCTAKGTTSDGFDIKSEDCVLIKCVSKGSSNDGFQISGDANVIEKCRSIAPAHYGFWADAPNTNFTKCTSVRAGDDGFRLEPAAVGSALTKNKATKSGAFDLNDGTPPGSCTFSKNKFATTNP